MNPLIFDGAVTRSRALNQGLAEYVTKLIAADLRKAGMPVPEVKHARRVATMSQDLAVPKVPVKDVPKLIPESKPDAKYLQALDFTRNRLLDKPITPPIRVATVCWWCNERYQKGEIPADYEGNQVHGKCRRAIARTGGVK